jgi:hypothetical protein
VRREIRMLIVSPEGKRYFLAASLRSLGFESAAFRCLPLPNWLAVSSVLARRGPLRYGGHRGIRGFAVGGV